MQKIFKSNKVFILLFLLIWSSALVFRLSSDKGGLLMSLGAKHSDGLNLLFSIITQLAEGHTYLVVVMVFLFIRFKSSIIIGVTGISIMILANLCKQFFAYERPFLYYRNLGLESTYQQISGIDPYVGLTSFPSGHTMAGFGLMFLLSLFSKNQKLQVLFLVLAVLIGLSRIYLGHHFLEDVIAGSILGVLIGLLSFFFIEKWNNPPLDKAMRLRKNKA